jgi:tetratricopeptide (TPR) repeat protein
MQPVSDQTNPAMESALSTLAVGVEFHQNGKLDKAERVYQRVLRNMPTLAEAWHLLGLLRFQTNRFQPAADYFEQALALEPQNPLYLNIFGITLRNLGQMERAASILEQAVAINPDDADQHVELGLVLTHLNQFSAALACYRQAIALNPDHAPAHRNLAVLLWREEKLADAAFHFERAVQLDPNDAEACRGLGDLLHQQGNLVKAGGWYAKWVQLTPDSAAAHFKLGLTLWERGLADKAEVHFRRVLALKPAHAEACFNLAAIAEQRNQPQQAADLWLRALEIRPDFAAAHYNLGLFYLHNNQFDQAQSNLERAVELDPTNADAAYSLAVILAQQDSIESADRFYVQALRLRPHHALWQLEKDTLCPGIMDSAAAIVSWRARYQAGLTRTPTASILVNEWLEHLPTTNAYPNWGVSYHGGNQKQFKIDYARRFSLKEIDPPAGQKPLHPGGAYRVGFLVTGGHEKIFLSLMGGLIDHFDQPDMAVQIICPAASIPLIRSRISNERVRFLPLPAKLAEAVQTIKAEQLDLILHWEVGSDATNYFLPFFRLAPVQCVTWGLSITTGVPNMDYFISSHLLESENAQDHYSEKLINLATLPTYFYRPELPDPLKPRACFGLPDDAHIYLCPQNLLKVHPDFDPILGQILRRDPRGTVVFLEDKSRQRQQKLMARFEKSMPDVAGRIRFLPRMEKQDFVNLIAVADVNLDTLHYSGGNTAHEGLATGTPIVTLPTEFLRGRLTLGRYKKMGVFDCVASSPQEYVELALRLGTDPEYNRAIRHKILQANHALYNDTAAVTEFTRFFKQAIDAARRGTVVSELTAGEHKNKPEAQPAPAIEQLAFDTQPVASWPSVSVCMIVKNEAHQLADCLSSLGDFASEVIVVDTGSTDRTVEIARAFGAVIKHFEWIDDFSAARNESLKNAQSDWIFVFDADDRLAAEELVRLKNALVSNQADGYFCRVVSPGKNSVLVANHFRLLRNHRGVRFERPLHEDASGSAVRQGLTLAHTNIAITHTGYSNSPDAIRRKQQRNQKILRAHFKPDGDDLYWRFHFGVNAYLLKEYDTAAQHFAAVLDNPPGSLRQQAGRLYEAHALLVDTYAKLGRFEQAEHLLKKTLRAYPNRQHPWILAGQFYLAQQSLQHAIQALEHARAMPPDNHAYSMVWPAGTLETWLCRAYIQLAQQGYKHGDFASMAGALARCTDLVSAASQLAAEERATVYKLSAVALQQTGREADALNCWQLAQALENDQVIVARQVEELTE